MCSLTSNAAVIRKSAWVDQASGGPPPSGCNPARHESLYPGETECLTPNDTFLASLLDRERQIIGIFDARFFDELIAKSQSATTGEEASMAWQPQRTPSIDCERIKMLLSQLESEDSTLCKRLLDAAVTGIEVARSPQNVRFRDEAERAWLALEPILSHHLRCESQEVLAWAERYDQIEPKAIERAGERVHELCELLRQVANSSFRSGSDAEAAQAGRKLCALAIRIDDFIESEQHALFPIIHKKLFNTSAEKAVI